MRGTAYVELGKTRLAIQSFEEARALPQIGHAAHCRIPMLLSLDQLSVRGSGLPSQCSLRLTTLCMEHACLRASCALDVAVLCSSYASRVSLQPIMRCPCRPSALLIALKRYRDAEKDLDVLAKAAPAEPRAYYPGQESRDTGGDECCRRPRCAMSLSWWTLALVWLSSREQLRCRPLSIMLWATVRRPAAI